MATNNANERTAGAGAGNDPAYDAWPPLPYEAWRDSLDTLHMWTQIVGKVKLALSPWLNQWWQVALQVDARGLTTGPMPVGRRVAQVDFDFVGHNLFVRTGEGGLKALPLVARPVAEFYGEFFAALAALGIDVAIDPMPVEVPNPIACDVNYTHDDYDPAAANRFWRVLASTERVLQRWRSPFAGKSSPVNFFWGSFDLNATRFSGRPAEPPAGAPRFLQLAEDQENVAVGFWPGNATLSGLVLGEPAFYAYAYPEPAGMRDAPIRPDAARYDQRFGEFILPYEAVRQDPDPDAALLAFFRSAYDAAADAGDWDRTALEQPVPELAGRQVGGSAGRQASER